MSIGNYEIGDKVRIKSNLVGGEEYGLFFNNSMEQYKGKEVKIVRVKTDSRFDKGNFYRLDIDNERWGWTDEMLEPVKEDSVTTPDYDTEYTYQELIPIIQDGQTYESISDSFRVKSILREGEILYFNGNDDLCDLSNKSIFPIYLSQKFKLKQPTREYFVYYVSLCEDGEEMKFVSKDSKDYFVPDEIVSCNIDDNKYYGRIKRHSYEKLTEKEYLYLCTIETIKKYK